MNAAAVLCAASTLVPSPAARAGIAPVGPAQEAQSRSPATASDLAARLGSVRAALGSCDWQRLHHESRELLGLAPRGSDAWIEAAGWQAVSAWKLGEHSRLEQIARDAETALEERRREDPRARQELRLALDPAAFLAAQHLEMCMASLLQARARHGEALRHLDRARSGLAGVHDEQAQGLLREVELSRAQSLRALGREDEARSLMRSLRDRCRASRVGAAACAILQENGARPEEYRGKYAGDAGHAQRMQRLWSLVPAARTRLAAAIGWEEEQLATPWIGVADDEPESAGLGAVTDGDPQRPGVPCVIVVHSEPLAIGLDEPETLLVHELAHAALTQSLGLRYEAMPAWLREGLAQAASGEVRDCAELYVNHAHDEDPELFLAPDFWKRAPLVFDCEPCDPLGPPTGTLLCLELCAASDGRGLVEACRALRAGKPWQDALEAATGLGADEYLVRAKERARRAVEAERERSLPGFRRLDRAAHGTFEEALAAAEDVLAHAPPRIVRGRALNVRAEALAGLHRHAEALAAWRELAAPGTVLAGYAEKSRMGSALCLIALGRRAEGERCLVELERDAVQEPMRALAAGRLRELRSGG